MRPFWTRYLTPQDKTPGSGTPVKTMRYPSDEAEVPEPREEPPGAGEKEPEVWTMRFPSDEPEIPDPAAKP